MLKFRVGHGFDVHQLVPGRALIIGGVKIEHDRGLLGHSDADVLLHAISDALLGAASMGDIGKHFPESDVRYKGMDSRERSGVSRVSSNGIASRGSRSNSANLAGSTRPCHRTSAI